MITFIFNGIDSRPNQFKKPVKSNLILKLTFFLFYRTLEIFLLQDIKKDSNVFPYHQRIFLLYSNTLYLIQCHRTVPSKQNCWIVSLDVKKIARRLYSQIVQKVRHLLSVYHQILESSLGNRKFIVSINNQSSEIYPIVPCYLREPF